MYYKLINNDIKYDIKDIKELNDIKNKEIVLEVDISYNQLTQLPDCINDFANLQELFYCSNKLMATCAVWYLSTTLRKF
jgi:Leucine-rich repeat (LRR) protein